MSKIDLCFSGWIRGVTVEKAYDVMGNPIDVSGMSATELTDKLKAGELLVSLGDLLYNGDSEEIELFDYNASE